jgi:hypothetical protein
MCRNAKSGPLMGSMRRFLGPLMEPGVILYSKEDGNVKTLSALF